MKVSLTLLELDIMKAVWQHPPVTVRQVHSAVRPTRNLAYTTVMTIMDRLYHKGFLKRTLNVRTHYYEPSIAYEAAREDALTSLVEAYFGGSREELMDFLGGHGDSNEGVGVFHTPNSIDEALL